MPTPTGSVTGAANKGSDLQADDEAEKTTGEDGWSSLQDLCRRSRLIGQELSWAGARVALRGFFVHTVMIVGRPDMICVAAGFNAVYATCPQKLVRSL